MMMKVVETLARTGVDVISKPELLAEIQTEFANQKVQEIEKIAWRNPGDFFKMQIFVFALLIHSGYFLSC